MSDVDGERALARWRLLLGRFADPTLGSSLDGRDAYRRMDRVLDHLYGREYGRRGDREGRRGAGLDPSALTVPAWLQEVRALFPRETVEVLERDALMRYGMTELVTDPEVLRTLEPSYELLKAVLAFRGLMRGEVVELARALVRTTVAELRRRWESEVRPVLWGPLRRRERRPRGTAADFDGKRTIRTNLQRWDPTRRRLLAERLCFLSRARRHLPWHVILAVDCSSSMMDSVIHSAVMAGIFRGLPALTVSLVAFDTSVVDLTAHADDPVSVLMSVQLGGGTCIAGALTYCESLVTTPTRTILVLVTDFEEGGPREELLAAVKRIRESGVRLLGLAALGADAEPAYDRELASRCVAAGADVAALTPRGLAEWMARLLS